MGLKRISRKELENRIENLEQLIAQKGIGSAYPSRAEQIQRDVNIALIAGTTVIVVGITMWAWCSLKS